MTNVRLRDDQWTKIYNFLVDDPNVFVGKDESAYRRFVEAILWMNRSGAQWHLLPADYGNWNSVYKRYARWCDQTKIHITVDGLGNPLRLRLTAGQRHDILQAADLIAGFNFERVIADRGYAA